MKTKSATTRKSNGKKRTTGARLGVAASRTTSAPRLTELEARVLRAHPPTSWVRVADLVVDTSRARAPTVARARRSLPEIGQTVPVLISRDGVVLTDHARVVAARRLGLRYIAAVRVDAVGLEAELVGLHEELLLREDLTVLERAEKWARLKEIYETLHPRARHGGRRQRRGAPGNQEETVSFARYMAADGRTDRSVRQYLQVAKLYDATKAVVRGSAMEDRLTDLMALARETDPTEQRRLAELAVTGTSDDLVLPAEAMERDHGRVEAARRVLGRIAVGSDRDLAIEQVAAALKMLPRVPRDCRRMAERIVDAGIRDAAAARAAALHMIETGEIPTSVVASVRGPSRSTASTRVVQSRRATATLIHGLDVLDGLRQLPSGSVHAVVTSPPYYGARDYGVVGTIGSEDSPEQYVDRLAEVFDEIARVLREDGTVWLVLDDVYLDKQLAGLPWRVVARLQERGWMLRQDCVWLQAEDDGTARGMPEHVSDRPTRSHEYVFMLVRQGDGYYYDQVATLLPTGGNDRSWFCAPPQKGKGPHPAAFPERLVSHFLPRSVSPMGCCASCGTPWRRAVKQTTYSPFRARVPQGTSPTMSYKGSDFRTSEPPDREDRGFFPSCSCGTSARRNCVVLDPFSGWATTGVVAVRHGCDYVGLDIQAAYLDAAEKRVLEAVPSLVSSGDTATAESDVAAPGAAQEAETSRFQRNGSPSRLRAAP
jgi:DNA modification methylase